jgi:hypothetical protein
MSEWLDDSNAERARRQAVDFSGGEPVDVFCGLSVFVEFDSDRARRQPVTRPVPGQPGRWVHAYSSLERLASVRGDPDVEYSCLSGARLLTLLPDHAGVWFDHLFPGSRAILLPTPDFSTGTSP